MIPWISHLNAGEAPVVFSVERAEGAPVRVGPLICLEDILSDYAREVAAQEGGVEIFVNSTIDAWYGFSAEPWEHLALAQIRSVEHRIPTVRSVSTGVSAVIDHLGRLQAHVPSRPVGLDNLDEWPPEQLVEDVVLARNTADWPTPFARAGFAYPWSCAGVALAIAAARRRVIAAAWRRRG
jgi:apolipoprotein N-acyltransferase